MGVRYIGTLQRWLHFRTWKDYMMREVIPKIEVYDKMMADRLRHCGDFVYLIRCKFCGARHFAGYSRCKEKFCVNCQRVMAYIYFKQLYEIVSSYEYVYLLTLTSRSMVKLSDMVSYMLSCWRRLYNGKGRSYFRKRFKGFFRSIEIKKGRTGWHVHFHILLVSVCYGRDYEELRDMWKSVTGGEGSVYVQVVVGNKAKAILEVVKYILKPGSYRIEDWGEVIEATRGMKRISEGGVFRGVSQKGDKSFEEVKEENLVRFVCRVCGCTEGELIREIFGELMHDYFIYDCGRMEGESCEGIGGSEVVSGTGGCDSCRGTKGDLVEGEIGSSIGWKKSIGSSGGSDKGLVFVKGRRSVSGNNEKN